ncbi:M16 family metallopeptidase [Candidatus Tokpelaia sp.]|uniref:M16 family metallopeptidase n=1 Tax=Candidatus Tokpelaia sp. TaxID=2233777 RepID=UPI001238C4FA|nr:pitrilysin family protein [Candidatus Tokpelaia sp.]KAA6405093.1 insulinase family protein [Candidatus Tokpelaia sp.]
MNRIRLRASALLLFVWLLPFGSPARAVEIQDIMSPKGVHAWFVEDKTVPVLAIRFAFKGGAVQDPADKAGLINLMSGLLDEGAGTLESQAWQEKLDSLGADLSFAAGEDNISGAMKVLAENADKAAAMLALALQKPRFDQEPLNRVRDQIIVGIKAAERDPMTIAQKKFAVELYGRHPYARPIEGTPESLKTIGRADLQAAHSRLFARDNVKIGIVGAITKEQAAALIGKIFDALPAKAELRPVPPVRPHLGGLTTVHYTMPQTAINLVYPGVARKDKDYYAAYLLNYVLGGSGLTSRLFTEVREKRGLAYSVRSSLVNRDYSDSLVISTGTRAPSARQSLETIRTEVKKIAENGINEPELQQAKSYVIGAYAVQNMGSSGAIAATLVGLQEWDLPIDYIQKREAEINAVSLDEVNAVAKKLFTVEPAILMVGPIKD